MASYSRPVGFNVIEYTVSFQMRPATPPQGGHWLDYALGIAGLIEFGGLVSEWGAIEIPQFTIVCGREYKAVMEVDLL